MNILNVHIPIEVLNVLSWVIPLLLGITLPEVIRGMVAHACGDNTADRVNRVTFNLFSHVNLVGTIIIPALMAIFKSPVILGYATPIPVSYPKLAHERISVILIAISGLLMCALLALLATVLIEMQYFASKYDAPWYYQNLEHLLLISSSMFVFNLIPLMPLDAGRILYAFLPRILRWKFVLTEPYSVWGILLVLFAPVLFGYDMILDQFAAYVEMLIETLSVYVKIMSDYL